MSRRSSVWMAAGIAAAFAGSVVMAAAQQAAPKPAAKPPQDKTKLPELSAQEQQAIDAAVPSTATAKPAKPRRVLVFWRCEGFFHGSGIAGGNRSIATMAEKTGAFTADFSIDYADFDAASLAKYDAVVLNNTTQLAIPDDGKKQALLDFVRRGKGLVGIHAATDNFYKWPEAAAMMGGLFAGHPWGGGGTWAVKIDDPGHVLNRAFGGKGYKLKDEIYQFKDPYTRADRRVLLTLDLSDADTAKPAEKGGRADKDYAISWIRAEGKGRVFYCSHGHAANVFADAPVVGHFLDGIQYALGDLPADATPKQ